MRRSFHVGDECERREVRAKSERRERRHTRTSLQMSVRAEGVSGSEWE